MQEQKESFPLIRQIIRVGLAELFFLVPLLFYAWATTFAITKDTAAELIILVLGIIWALVIIEKPTLSSFRYPLALPILAFMAALLISLFQTNNYYTALVDLGRWGSYFLVYFLILWSIQEKKWIRIILWTTLFAGALAALYSLMQFYGLDLPFWMRLRGRGRLFSTFGNPNYLAGYLAGCLPLTFILFLHFRVRKYRLILAALLCVLYASLLITFTRGAWVALFLSFIVLIVLLLLYADVRTLMKNKFWLCGLTLPLLVITILYSTPNCLNPTGKSIVQRGVSSLDLTNSTTRQRFLIWLSTLQIIKENPIAGTGVGTFCLHYPSAQAQVLAKEKYRHYVPKTNRSINAHNDYLQLASETGTIGLVCFLWLIVSFYRHTLRFLRKHRKETPLLLFGIMGGITSILIHAFFSFPFHIFQNGMLFWMLLASSVIVMRESPKTPEESGFEEQPTLEEPAPKKRRILAKRAAQIAVIMLAIFLSAWRIRIFVSDIYVKKGEILMERGIDHQAVEKLRRATRFDPHNGQAHANLAEIYGRFGRYQESIAEAKKATINWFHPKLYHQMAFAYFKVGKLKEAEEITKKAIYFFPNFAPAWINLGYLSLLHTGEALSQDDTERANEMLDWAIVCYLQGNVFQPGSSLPPDISSLLDHLGSRMSKTRQTSQVLLRKRIIPWYFFLKESPYLIVVLEPSAKAEKPFYFKVFFYSAEEKGHSLSGNIRIETLGGELEKEIRLSPCRVDASGPLLLSFLVKEGFPKGQHRIKLRLSLDGESILEEKEFSILGAFSRVGG